MRRNKTLEALENEQLKTDVPEFSTGDTVVVQVKVREGNRARLQAFEGVVIGKRNRGLNSSFTVRKISHGIGVERSFQTHSPLIASITVKRKGDVRKAKLYYLRDRSGRAARIKEKVSMVGSLTVNQLFTWQFDAGQSPAANCSTSKYFKWANCGTSEFFRKP